jgi:hypothetical protein
MSNIFSVELLGLRYRRLPAKFVPFHSILQVNETIYETLHNKMLIKKARLLLNAVNGTWYTLNKNVPQKYGTFYQEVKVISFVPAGSSP